MTSQQLLTDKRVVLVGGKGGVGKTTLSSAFALLAAERGRKCLLVSTDPAHSLADAFDRPIGDNITRLAANLDGLEIDPDKEVQEHVERVMAQMKRFTQPDMFPEIERQLRLTQQSPGAQEAALLERISRLIDEGLNDYDLIVFDTAPTGHTLRLLSLPEAMAAWTQGMLKQTDKSAQLKGVLDHLSPKSGKDIQNPMADAAEHETDGMSDRTKAITDSLRKRQQLFQRTRRILKDPSQTALLFVLTPEKLPILETARSVQALAGESLPLAGLLINRVLPDSADGEFMAQRRKQEKTYLADIETLFAQQQRWYIPLQANDIQGLSELTDMAVQLADKGL